MAILTAVQDGDLTDSATWGGSTPANGDQLYLGGYTIFCDTDLSAHATGFDFEGTGTLLMKDGAYIRLSDEIPSGIAVQFGEPTGTGDGPLPATGSLPYNASAGFVWTANLNGVIKGPLLGYTAEQTEKGTVRISGYVSTTEFTIDDNGVVPAVGDALNVMSYNYLYQKTVTAYDSVTRTVTLDSAATALAIAENEVVQFTSAPILFNKVNTGNYAVCSGDDVDFSEADIMLHNEGGSNTVLFGGNKIRVRRAFVCGYYGTFSSAVTGWCGEVFCNHQFTGGYMIMDAGRVECKYCLPSNQARCLINIGTLVVYYDGLNLLSSGYAGYASRIRIKNATTQGGGLSVDYSGAYENLLVVGDRNEGEETWYNEGGLASLVQTIPEGTDLPDAYLLEPDSDGKAYYEFKAVCKRGQSIQLAYHFWLGGGDAQGGIEIFDEDQEARLSSPPLTSYDFPTGTTLEWVRGNIQHTNSTAADQYLTVRVWATGTDETYARVGVAEGGSVG
jgi:hypothetical protein